MESISNGKPIRQRIHLLDELRGFALLCMVFYHAFFAMAVLFKMELGNKLIAFFMPAEPFFAVLFIGISGVSSRLSQNNWKRGVRLLGVALLITAATVGLDSFFHVGATILFGVIHMLSLSILIFHFTKTGLDAISPLLGLCLFSFLFLMTYNIYYGYLGWGALRITLPDSWYQTNFFFPFGLVNDAFYSADYFPLIPWLFIFIAGTYLGIWAQQGKFPAWTYRSRFPFLQWLGRHSLIIYILHQPVISGILFLLSHVV